MGFSSWLGITIPWGALKTILILKPLDQLNQNFLWVGEWAWTLLSL